MKWNDKIGMKISEKNSKKHHRKKQIQEQTTFRQKTTREGIH